MELINRLNQDLLDATKGGDSLKRDLLRMVKTAIKNKEIALGHPLSDDETLSVIAKEIKQRHEAATAFTAGQRPELAKKEEDEAVLLAAYLPTQLSKTEIEELVKAAISEAGAQSVKEMGAVMAILMPKLQGRADSGIVSQLVRQSLGA